MQNTMKSIFISLIILASFSQMQSVAQNIEIPCEVTPFSEDILQEESGDLLTISGNYDDGYVVHSTSENFVEVAYGSNTLSLSPQGDWLLFKEYDYENNVINLRLMNLENNNSYEMPYETNFQSYDTVLFSWFEAPQILMSRRTVLPKFLPLAVVDIREQRIDYIFSQWLEIILDDELSTIESDPLLPDTFEGQNFTISPNGQYLLWYEQYPVDESVFYDVTTREVLLVNEHFLGEFLWSQDSESIIFLDGLASPAIGDQFYVFDIASNTFERVSDFDFDADVLLGIEDESWSPDNHYLAFRMTPRLSQLGTLLILDTTNGEVYSSCFTNTGEFREFGFAWSHDSRFLAFEGVLDEREGIYIYDVMENRFYEFEYRNRGILGWSSSGNQDQ